MTGSTRKHLLLGAALGTIAAVAITLVSVVMLVRRSPSAPPPRTMKFPLVLGEGQQFFGFSGREIAISPDGSKIAYAANGRLYLRALGDAEARPIPGTDLGATTPEFSPDGLSLAFRTQNPLTIKRIGELVRAFEIRGGFQNPKAAEIGIYDLSGAAAVRVLVGSGSNGNPIWSAEGRRITFSSNREGDFGLFWQRADGNGPAERLTKPEPSTDHLPDAWSPDGKTLLFEAYGGDPAATHSSLWTLSWPDRKIERFGAVESSVFINATFAPNGRWVAYNTGEGAAARVYVEPFPRTGDRHVVTSTEPGQNPIWSRDGRQLFYASGVDQFRAVTFSTQPAVRFGRPVLLPRGGLYDYAEGSASRTQYDLSPDGQRMLGIIAAQTPREALAPTIQVVLNWSEELKAKVP